MFRYLICDPGNLKWEQMCPGALYVALSRAKTMENFRSGTKFTKHSVIYWVGDGINKIRILDGSMKAGRKSGDPEVTCELIIKRDRWVRYLQKQRRETTATKYRKSEINRFHETRYSQSAIRHAIGEIIINPNKSWLARKRKDYLMPASYFGTYS